MSNSTPTTDLVLNFPATLAYDDIVALIRSFSIRPNDRRFGPGRPLIFELKASHQAVEWRLRLVESQRRLVVDQLQAHLPSVRVEPAEQPSAIVVDEAEEGQMARLAVELRLSAHGRPLRSDVAAELSTGLLGGLQNLTRGEQVVVQWFLGPPLPRRVAKAAPITGSQPVIERMIHPPRLDSEEARKRNDKQREPVFAALGRIAVTAATRARRRSLLTSTLGQLRLTSEPSAHLLARSFWNSWTLRRFDQQVVPRFEWPCSLNASEFAALVAWPIDGPVATGVAYSGRRELPFAESLLVEPAAVAAMNKLGRNPFRIIGEASYPGRNGLVSVEAKDALQHLHVVGPTGVGKSTVLANLALQDIAAGRAVVVIEPKGDLVADILDRIPENRLDDVVLLDPSDGDHAVGLNALSGSGRSVGAVETTVDALVHLFKSLFASSWGPRTQDVLHASLLTLARTPGMTLVELPLLLTDARFRVGLTAKLRGDIALGPFWGWYESLSDGERSQVISPVLNKVRAFTMRSSVRRIIGQSKPSFQMLDVFTKRRILLVPLKRGEIGPETAALLGGLVMAQLWQATQSRSAIDPAKRHPVMVYLDEFQTYLHLPTELGDVLAQARGLGVGLTLAHQHLGQLVPAEMKAAVLLNARSRIVFQSGEKDAVELAKNLGGGLTAGDITGLAAYEAYARLMSNGSSTSPGSMTTKPLAKSLNTHSATTTRSRSRYARASNEIDAEILGRRETDNKSGSGGGRRRRTS